MSRIGRLPVAIPAGVEVTVAEGNVVTVKGPKGTLERALPTEMEIKVEDGHVVVSRPNDLKKMKSLHGLTRSLIHNMVVGVSEGYTKELEVNGVGYKAAKQGKKLVLSLGYSHPVEMIDPEGVETVPDEMFRNFNMKEVKLPSTIKTIGANAFYNCKKLVKINFPASLKEIGKDAFCWTEIGDCISKEWQAKKDTFYTSFAEYEKKQKEEQAKRRNAKSIDCTGEAFDAVSGAYSYLSLIHI